MLDLVTQVPDHLLGAVLVLNPSLLVHQVHLGSTPSYSHLIFALSLAMLAYTGIETVSNMAEEARDPGQGRAASAVNLHPDRRARRLRRHDGRRAVGAAGDRPRRARDHAARTPPSRRLPERPGAGDHLSTSGSRTGVTHVCATTSASWRRRSCSSPPTRG